jgi:uncharacterized protein YbjT (DUF2867 family)
MNQPRQFAAVVLGATGNVGRQVVKLLLEDAGVTRVVVVNRRVTAASGDDPRLVEVVVNDLSKLAGAVSLAARRAGATVGICTIGIGKGSRKMSDADVKRVEIEYPREFARGCKDGGVLSFGLMTAAGADPKASSKYLAIMGEKEKAVIDAGFPAVSIFRPSVIFGNSNTPGYLHYLFPVVERVLPWRFHSIHKDELAKAIAGRTREALGEILQGARPAAAGAAANVRVLHYADMKKYFGKEQSLGESPAAPQ